jgi:hypothetical protein
MKMSLSVVVLVLAFWCGFMVGEYQHAKFEQRLQKQRNWVEIVNRLEKSERLQKALDDAIRRRLADEDRRR